MRAKLICKWVALNKKQMETRGKATLRTSSAIRTLWEWSGQPCPPPSVITKCVATGNMPVQRVIVLCDFSRVCGVTLQTASAIPEHASIESEATIMVEDPGRTLTSVEGIAR